MMSLAGHIVFHVAEGCNPHGQALSRRVESFRGSAKEFEYFFTFRFLGKIQHEYDAMNETITSWRLQQRMISKHTYPNERGAPTSNRWVAE